MIIINVRGIVMHKYIHCSCDGGTPEQTLIASWHFYTRAIGHPRLYTYAWRDQDYQSHQAALCETL